MRKAVVFLLIVCLTAPVAWAKSALDLMLEGRYSEAKAILDATVASPRYQLIYFALTESESARACSLYQVIAIRYPNTDCDSVARARLDQARDMGVVVVPINEWADAPSGVKPLGMRRAQAAPPPPPPVAVAPKPAVQTTAVDTVAHRPMTIAQLDTTQVGRAEIVSEKPAEKAVDLTVSFSKAEKPDSSKPIAPPSATKPQMATAMPSKVVHPDTAVVAKVETKKAMPPVAAPPKIVHPDTAVVAKVETKKEAPPAAAPAVNKQEMPIPAINTPKVPAPTEVAKPVVKEPVVSTPKPVVPPPPLAATKVAPAETLKAVKVEPAKAVGDTLTANANVKPTKPLLTPHDKPMAAPGQWFIQVGAFANFDNAHRLATTLQKAGYPIKLVPRESGDKKLLQVRVGGYGKRDDCVPVADELKSKYQVPAVIISE